MMSASLNQGAIRAVQLQETLNALLGFREPFHPMALSNEARVKLRKSLEAELAVHLQNIRLQLERMQERQVTT